MEIRLQLQQIRKGKLSIEQYFTHVKSIVHHLTTIGGTIPVEEVVMHNVRGLGSYLWIFLISINLRSTDSNLFELQRFIFIEEQSILTNTNFEEDKVL